MLEKALNELLDGVFSHVVLSVVLLPVQWGQQYSEPDGSGSARAEAVCSV